MSRYKMNFQVIVPVRKIGNHAAIYVIQNHPKEDVGFA